MVFILLNGLWAFGPVVWCLPLENLGKNLCYYSTNSSVLFFLLFPVFPLSIFYNFCNCPTILEHSIPLLSFFSSLHFTLGNSIDISLSELILSLNTYKSIKDILYFVTVFFIYSIFFVFFLRSSFWLFTYSCMLFTFLLRPWIS